MSDDKYPDESGRRRFVKGVVGSSALVGLGTAGVASITVTTQQSGKGGGTTTYFGIENIDGPAPRSMPLIPLEIDGDGYIKGIYPTVSEETQAGETVKVAKQEIGGATYTPDWFQYCGVQGYEGVDPSYDGDNYFRYSSGSGFDWQSSEVSAGDRMNVDDFSDYETWGNGIGESGIGKPAIGTWRSQDTKNTIPIHLLRSTKIEEAAQDNEFLQAATSQGVMAWMNKCTHFCCVPGFKKTAQSAEFGSANDVYCPCHQSVYDPFSVVNQSFVAYPRPEDN